MAAVFPDPETALKACGVRGPWRGIRPLSGGVFGRVFRAETGDGRVCLKIGPPHPLREREGLEALAAAESGLCVPKVLGHWVPENGPGALALEYLAPGPADWEALGRVLAELHRRSEKHFGFFHDNFLGATPQENGWMENWGLFFAERRIGALVRRLERAGELSGAESGLYAKLLEKIPSLLSHLPAPALLHGDLWSGNFLPSQKGPALIDPAVYFGDREAEWAMMRLFGGFPQAALSAYQESFPLPAGWRERQPLYQLYHLLNHQLLFGGGYGAQAMAVARNYL